jgi:hypothetical protein
MARKSNINIFVCLFNSFLLGRKSIEKRLKLTKLKGVYKNIISKETNSINSANISAIKCTTSTSTQKGVISNEKMTKAIMITSVILLLSACSSSNEKEQAFINSKEQAKSNVSVTNRRLLYSKKNSFYLRL